MNAASLTGPLKEPRTASAAREFARRFQLLVAGLPLADAIHQQAASRLNDFADAHPDLRAGYASANVDESYFADGSCGWEAAARPKAQALAIAGGNLFEFLAFAHGFRAHVTALDSIVNVEETWLLPGTDAPPILRVCLHHSFPATTVIYAPDAESQPSARSFVERLSYLRGF